MSYIAFYFFESMYSKVHLSLYLEALQLSDRKPENKMTFYFIT